MALANVSPGSFRHLLHPDEMCLFVNLHSLAARLGKVQTKSYPTGGKKSLSCAYFQPTPCLSANQSMGGKATVSLK